MSSEHLPLPVAQRNEEITEQDLALLRQKAEELQRKKKKAQPPRRIPMRKKKNPVG